MSPQPIPSSSLAVAHVAGETRPYQGEDVVFYTRVQVGSASPANAVRALKPVTVRIVLPRGLDPQHWHAARPEAGVPVLTQDAGATNVIWMLNAPDPGASYEFEVVARVAPTAEEQALYSRAVASAPLPDGGTDWAEETATVTVGPQGSYVKYLPAIYREDELMGRLLMLFESFWGPIERQVRDLSLYFDPRLTTPEMLPWLASWLDLVLDEQWPEAQRRLLLRSAAALYRKRGTRVGLEEYLMIYSGVRPRIVEHRAHNLRLSPEARLGLGVALGRANVPHSFTVFLAVPGGELPPGMLRRVQGIIEAEKPAHTTYMLRIENDGSRND